MSCESTQFPPPPEEDGLRVRAGCICFKDSTCKQILLVQSLKSSKFWLLPGGRLEFGETIYESAVRELYEEGGLIASLVTCIAVFMFENRATFMFEALNVECCDEWPEKQYRKRQWVNLENAEVLLKSQFQKSILKYFIQNRSSSLTISIPAANTNTLTDNTLQTIQQQPHFYRINLNCGTDDTTNNKNITANSQSVSEDSGGFIRPSCFLPCTHIAVPSISEMKLNIPTYVVETDSENCSSVVLSDSKMKLLTERREDKCKRVHNYEHRPTKADEDAQQLMPNIDDSLSLLNFEQHSIKGASATNSSQLCQNDANCNHYSQNSPSTNSKLVFVGNLQTSNLTFFNISERIKTLFVH